MWYLLLFFIPSTLWIAYEMWSAPHGEETDKGFKITKPGKKFRDLWRKQS